MKEDIKKRWVEALRSGNYKQGIGRLQDKSGAFCCLGVLCDVAKEDGKGTWTTDDKVCFIEAGTGFFGSGFLSTGVVEWAGLLSRDPRVKVVSDVPKYDQFKTLSELNDHGVSFLEIADLIEKTL